MQFEGRSAAVALALAIAVATAPALAVVGGRTDEGPLRDVSLMVLASRGSVCSGVVVAADVVLTAAHCVTGAAAYRVHYRNAAGEPVLIEPQAIAVHPGYDAKAIKARRRSIDLALVRLPEPLPAPFAPAKLASAASSPPPGTALTLGGWGVAREGDGRSSGTFRTAALAALDPYGPSKILLWAGDPEGLGKRPGAGVCEGDSGGPIADAAGRVIAVSTWASGHGRSRCGLMTQGVLLGPQRAFVDRTLASWGRSAQWE